MVRPNTDDERLVAWLAGRLPEHERRAIEQSLDAPEQPAETPPALVGLDHHRPAPPADLTALIESLKTRPPDTTTPAHPDAWRDLLTPDPDPAVLGRLDNFQVIAPVATSGMGVVLKARDPELNRTVALKILSPDLATNRTACRRFLHEARAAAKLEHENILPVYAVHESAGVPYFAMRFATGGSLQDRLDRGEHFTAAELKTIATGIANALAAAHAKGIVHRDIKPANVLFDDGALGQLWVCDFGIARSTEDPSLTYPGTVAGTPLYMSPEQAAGQPVDQRSDLFSLGALLYHLAAGHPPFPGETTPAVINAVIAAEPDLTPLRTSPPWFANLVAHLLAKHPDHRPATATAVAHAIDLEHSPRPRRRPARLKHLLLSFAALALATAAAIQLPASKRAINTHLLGRDLDPAFTITGKLGAYPSLSNTVALALDGDTIEIRATKPVPLANLRFPIGKKLTLKPAPGTARVTLATARPGALAISAADHLRLLDIDFQLGSSSAMTPMLFLAAGAELSRCTFHSSGDVIHGPFYSNPCAILLANGHLEIRDTTFGPSISVPVRLRSGSPTVHLADSTAAAASYIVHVPNPASPGSVSITATNCDLAASNLYRQDNPQPIPVTLEVNACRLAMATRTAWLASTDPSRSNTNFHWTGTANHYPLGGAEVRFQPVPESIATSETRRLDPQPPLVRIDATAETFTDLATAIAAAPDGATLLLSGDFECTTQINTPPGHTLTLSAAPGPQPTIISRLRADPAIAFHGPTTLTGLRFHRYPAEPDAQPIVTISPGGATCLIEDCQFLTTTSNLSDTVDRALGIDHSATATIRRCHFRTPAGHALLLGSETPQLHIEDSTIIAASIIEHQNPDPASPTTITINRTTLVADTAITGDSTTPTQIDLATCLLQLTQPTPDHIAWNPAPDVIHGTPFKIAPYPPYLLTADTLQKSLDPTLTGPAIQAFKTRPPSPK